MNNRSLAPSLLLASLIVSTASFAAPIDSDTRLVRYGDLDLSTAAGMKSLHRRVEIALNAACLDPYGPGPAGTINLACKSESRLNASAQIDQAVARQQASRASQGSRQALELSTPATELRR